jgi:tetratricopeptide (TPR) repeat protein
MLVSAFRIQLLGLRVGKQPEMSAKKPPTPVTDRRSAQALELFEKAVNAVGKHDYGRAKEILETLISSHPEERDVLERARAYLALCDRALEKKPAFRPKTFEDLLNYGVYLHNRGEFQEALKYLQQAAEIHPKNEHVLYCVAASAARSGDAAVAMKALRSAIVANPASRAQARSDSDFDPIREDEEFSALVHSSQA